MVRWYTVCRANESKAMELDSCLWISQTSDKLMTYETARSFIQAWCAVHEVKEKMQVERTKSSSDISLNTYALLTYTLFTFQVIDAVQDPMHSRPTVVDSSWSNEDACNITFYVNWYESPYAGALMEESTNLWVPSDAGLTNGQAMEIISAACQLMMRTAHSNRAGRHGPSPDRYIYDVMCSEECTFSDSLREEVMMLTRCNCLQLSTLPTDPVYRIIGDWCRTNSGRILCETFGHCGRWNCRVGDFMCPRWVKIRPRKQRRRELKSKLPPSV